MAYYHIIDLIDYIFNYNIIKYYIFIDIKINIITIDIIDNTIKLF
jgi:hypothetical protein